MVCKWTNVRDCWKKCMKRRHERGLGGKPPRPYIYNRQLSFLLENDSDLISPEKFEMFYSDENSINDGEFVTDDTEASSSDQAIPSIFKEQTTTIRSGRKRKIEEQITSQTTAFDSQPNQKDEENRHMLFFQSLLPSLASLDDDQTIRFHIEVLTLVHKFRKQRHDASND